MGAPSKPFLGAPWNVQTFPKGFPSLGKTQSLFSCFSGFARRGFPSEALGGSHQPCLPAPSPAAPSAQPPPRPQGRALRTSPGRQIRAIESRHCVEPELLSQPFDPASPPSG